MYQSGNAKKKINPQQTSNIFSYVTFCYSIDIFKKAHRKDLEQGDIYEVVQNYESQKVGDELEQKWKQSKAGKENPSLYGVLWSCYGRTYMIFGAIQLIMKTIYIMVMPTSSSKLIKYFSSNQTEISKNDAIYYAVIMIGLNLINTIYSHNYIFQIIQLGMKVRTAFCSLIYRKCIKLSPAALGEFPPGRIVTMITKDVFSFDSAIMFANDIWIGFIQMIIITYLLYTKIGVATFAGIGFLVFTIPLQLLLGQASSATRIKTAKKTDARLQIIQEVLSAIKIIKMYVWEGSFLRKISEIRKQEIFKLRMVFYLKAITLCLGGLCSEISFYLLIMCFLWLGNNITAELVYFTLACFGALRSTITISIPIGVVQVAELHAAEKRVRNFLNAEELPTQSNSPNTPIDPMVSLKNVTVAIGERIVLSNIDLELKKGLTVVTGLIGNGKSSLLKTILRDYPVSFGKLNTRGSMSFASEEPWLFPATIKQNILFGEPYNESRYKEVIRVCALELDLSFLATGDETIVEDNGVNLSKGQQSRINLARAVYKTSDIYLLDDCLSSLDPKVQEHIFIECIKGFLGDKLCLLICHNSNFIKHADDVIILEDGRIKATYKPIASIENKVSRYIDDQEEKRKTIVDDIVDDLVADEEVENKTEETLLLVKNKVVANVYHEVNKTGKVLIRVYNNYVKFAGGYWIGGFVASLFIITQFAISYNPTLVSKWVNIEEKISSIQLNGATNTTEYEETIIKRNSILRNYSIMIVSATVLTLVRLFFHVRYFTRASINIHKALILKILTTTMDFFDTHLIGNVLNRFSKDIATIDEYIPFVMYECARILCLMASIVVLIVYVNPSFIIPVLVIFIIMFFIRKYYLPAGRSLKRLDNSTRSPVVGHLNASLEGLTTIRAYGRQNVVCREFDIHQNLYTSAYHMSQIAMRAFGLSLDLLCTVFIAAIVIRFLLADKDTSAGDVGLAISQAIMMTGLLQWGIRQWAELENQMTSVERVVEYTEAEVETKTGNIIKNWPNLGTITFDNVSLTYKKTNETVLKHITFEIEPKQKIGIVGRTGAGKSSVISSLFRLYKTEGAIYIDGVDINTLSTDFLRSKISIIPQDPVLFSGTIKDNIDPTGRYSDAEMWKAIDVVGLKNIIKDIHVKVTEGNSTFSAGQRQLLCLARAVIQNNVILILDEATANMDLETDALIHETIQKKFSHCTVITIAHRLHTVMNSDKVIVIDSGEIIEYDVPSNLLKNPESRFYKMVKKTKLL